MLPATARPAGGSHVDYPQARTLAGAIFPRFWGGGIRLPWTTVPITGQTFAVLVTGGALGARRGAGCLTVYMLLGMLGVPVFAPGSGATAGAWDVHFVLPWRGSEGYVWDISSGGYVVGFIFAAALVGYLAERRWDRKPWGHLGMFLGHVVVFVPGIL